MLLVCVCLWILDPLLHPYSPQSQTHNVKIIGVCPYWWESRGGNIDKSNSHMQTEGYDDLLTWRREGVLYMCPSSDHDDLYLLQVCSQMDGFIVSNDLFRNHTQLSKDYLRQRRIGFMFVGDRVSVDSLRFACCIQQF